MTARVVRERIDPRLTAALFANYRTPVDALLELLDNAVDSRIPGRPLEVDLALRPGTISLTIVGGTGMGLRELEREYLRWGGSSKRAGERIGRFGQGGKAAIGHLGARFDITAPEPVNHEPTASSTRPTAIAAACVPTRLSSITSPSTPTLATCASRSATSTARWSRGGSEPGSAMSIVPCSTRAARPACRPGAGHADAWPLEERHEFTVRAGGRLVRGWHGLLSDPPPAAIEGGRASITWVGSSGRPSGSATRARPSIRRSAGSSARWSCPTSRSRSTRATSSAAAPSGRPSRPGCTGSWRPWSAG